MATRSQERILWGLLLAATACAGCYTLLKHPQIRAAQEYAPAEHQENISFANDCQWCHNAEVAAFHAIAVPPSSAAPSARWQFYYEQPWWFRYYSAREVEASSPEEQQRAFDRRRLAVPAESTSGSTIPAVSVPTGGALSRQSVSDSSQAPAQSLQKEDNGKRPARRAPNRDRSDPKP